MTTATTAARVVRMCMGGAAVTSALLLGACGPGEVTAGDGSAAQGPADDAQSSAMQTVQLGDVSVSIPEGWTTSPDAEMDGDWTEGYDDAEAEPSVRIRMAPMINDSPHPDIAEAELVTRAMAGGYYGSEWEGEHRSKEDIPGAFRGFVTDFSYVSSEGEAMSGRWWLMTDPNTYEVAALEIAGQEEVLTDELIEEISDSVELRPQA